MGNGIFIDIKARN